MRHSSLISRAFIVEPNGISRWLGYVAYEPGARVVLIEQDVSCNIAKLIRPDDLVSQPLAEDSELQHEMTAREYVRKAVSEGRIMAEITPPPPRWHLRCADIEPSWRTELSREWQKRAMRERDEAFAMAMQFCGADDEVGQIQHSGRRRSEA